MEWLTDPAIWTALLTLTALEIVLGIDNIIFISILADRLPADQRQRARTTGLLLAMLMRIAMLFSIGWILGLTQTLFTVAGTPVQWPGSDPALGGLFLIYKSTTEIHAKLEGEEHERETGAGTVSFSSVIVQIVLLDIVFSLDSVITAIGMTTNITIAVVAVMISIGIMLVRGQTAGGFRESPPDGEDPGVELPAPDRDDAGRRRARTAHSEGVHLLRDGLLGRWWRSSTYDCARRANRSICTSNSTTRTWCRSPHALAASSRLSVRAGAVR